MSALLFPTMTALVETLNNKVLPGRVTSQPACFAFDPQGRVWVESAKYPRTVETRLRRLGVIASAAAESSPNQTAEHWFAIPALTPVGDGASGPVLFELPSMRMLPSFAAEARRLQSGTLEWRTDPRTGRALVRVARPSLFTLLRGDSGSADRPRAYVEQSPQVWVQFGYRHPVEKLPSPPGGLLTVIDAPRQWRHLQDGPYQSDSATMDLAAEFEPGADLPVPMVTVVPRLVPERHAVAPTFWVIHESAVNRLREFLRRADERLIARLQAGFVEIDGRVVALVAARGGMVPPVVMVDATGFRPYASLPNLFIPVQCRLTPALRRDIARRELAPDGERTFWFVPTPDGMQGFSAPADVLRPLAQWVKYATENLAAVAPAAVEPVFPFAPIETDERARSVRVPRQAKSGLLVWKPDGWEQRSKGPHDS